jgi:2-iminobutanoate/2-iminopropanoate deaminase
VYATPPYSVTRRAGELVFVSGQLGRKDNQLVDGGVGPETRQALANVAAALGEHGLDFSHVVKCTVFLASMADWPAMNEVYAELFGSPYPARSAVGIELLDGALVEIEAIAYGGAS